MLHVKIRQPVWCSSGYERWTKNTVNRVQIPSQSWSSPGNMPVTMSLPEWLHWIAVNMRRGLFVPSWGHWSKRRLWTNTLGYKSDFFGITRWTCIIFVVWLIVCSIRGWGLIRGHGRMHFPSGHCSTEGIALWQSLASCLLNVNYLNCVNWSLDLLHVTIIRWWPNPQSNLHMSLSNEIQWVPTTEWANMVIKLFHLCSCFAPSLSVLHKDCRA